MTGKSDRKPCTLFDHKRTVTPIIPSDDAFHGSLRHIGAEWWYFDALFADDLSIHVGYKTFSKKKWGLFAPQIEFYNKGACFLEENKRILFKDTMISKEFPSITHNGNAVMSFNKEKHHQSNQWEYQVNMETERCGFDLRFLGKTPGWKIEIPERESWTVALPKATVQGTIRFNDSTIPVEGLGYHDHNWNYTMVTVMNYGQGWYWGKIASNSFNVVWAKIVKSKQYELLAVINDDDQNTWYNINPKNIHISTDEYEKVGRFKTPSHFFLEIHEEKEGVPLDVEVDMKSYGTHYNSVIVAPYFRYHITAKGSISIDSKKEQVNPQQIMEFLRFS